MKVDGHSEYYVQYEQNEHYAYYEQYEQYLNVLNILLNFAFKRPCISQPLWKVAILDNFLVKIAYFSIRQYLCN